MSGLIDGPRGKAVLRSGTEDQVVLEFSWNEEPEPLLPIDLIVGLSRPQTSRKILQEATSLGVRRIHFVATDRGESHRMRCRSYGPPTSGDSVFGQASNKPFRLGSRKSASA